MMIKAIEYLFRLGGTATIVLTFLAYLSPYVNPSVFPWLSFFGTAFPWLLLLNGLLLLGWAWRRHRFALYHLGILLFGWPYITSFVGFHSPDKDLPPEAFSVATHNLGRMWKATKTPEQYAALAEEYAQFWRAKGIPDVLCTQETRGQFYPLLAEKLGYPYKFNLKKGTVILSRFPLEAGGEAPFGKTSNSALWADVRIGKRLVRVFNLHLQSNKVTSDTERVLEEGDLQEEKTWKDIRKVLRKVGGATRIRARQALLVREAVRESPHPVIICGDLNDTPNSYVYRQLTTGLTDTFREKGRGFGTTFAGALPLLRIDYALVDPMLRVHRCQIAKGPFSDHYPVVASLSWR
jgi:endonuclease/exonuclease/phosphatase family metal-dependent hydrolase